MKKAENAMAVPKGWKLVPIEPTEAMIQAVWKATLGGSILSAERAARAMLASAPTPGSEIAVLEQGRVG